MNKEYFIKKAQEIPYNYSNSKIIDTLSFLDETKI